MSRVPASAVKYLSLQNVGRLDPGATAFCALPCQSSPAEASRRATPVGRKAPIVSSDQAARPAALEHQLTVRPYSSAPVKTTSGLTSGSRPARGAGPRRTLRVSGPSLPRNSGSQRHSTSFLPQASARGHWQFRLSQEQSHRRLCASQKSMRFAFERCSKTRLPAHPFKHHQAELNPGHRLRSNCSFCFEAM